MWWARVLVNSLTDHTKTKVPLSLITWDPLKNFQSATARTYINPFLFPAKHKK